MDLEIGAIFKDGLTKRPASVNEFLEADNF
jgi:hypothetical protein